MIDQELNRIIARSANPNIGDSCHIPDYCNARALGLWEVQP